MAGSSPFDCDRTLSDLGSVLEVEEGEEVEMGDPPSTEFPVDGALTIGINDEVYSETKKGNLSQFYSLSSESQK